MLTEYEWRKRYGQSKRYAACWGAQCVYKHAKLRCLVHSSMFRRGIISGAIAVALMLPMVSPVQTEDVFAQQEVVMESAQNQPRQISAVRYDLPNEWVFQRALFSREELMAGKMLLLDDNHPLTSEVPMPNTFSIAQYGSGEVSVRSLAVKSGRETIDALKKLFHALRMQGVSNIYVAQGTTTAEEQLADQLMKARTLMKNAYPEEVIRIMKSTESISSQLQEYAVELRLWNAEARQPDLQPLSATTEGQQLLQLAWRFGFVRESMEHPYRFRYVGKAHATAMTYLDVELENYLDWLHQKKQLVVYEGGVASYLILCKEMDAAGVMFELPQDCVCEVSADNMGYAFAACILK